jgi:adenosylcobinamide hydrolase
MTPTTIPIPGLTLTLTPAYLWLRSERPLRFLSSGPGGDGVTEGRHIVSQHVGKGYCSDEPERDLAELVARLGIRADEGWVGLMTGVALDGAAVVVREREGLTVAAIVTVGLGNASAAGRDTNGGTTLAYSRIGTINAIVVIGAELTLAGAVNAVMTATEAKALSLIDRGVRTKSGDLASGTSSDAIVIASVLPEVRSAAAGTPLRYAGTATTLGLLIGETVREAITSRLP